MIGCCFTFTPLLYIQEKSTPTFLLLKSDYSCVWIYKIQNHFLSFLLFHFLTGLTKTIVIDSTTTLPKLALPDTLSQAKWIPMTKMMQRII